MFVVANAFQPTFTDISSFFIYAIAKITLVEGLVEVDADGARSTYFMGPKGGGLEITHRRKEIMVMTPQSPLGQNLIGRRAGHRWTAKLGGSTIKYHIVSVS